MNELIDKPWYRLAKVLYIAAYVVVLSLTSFFVINVVGIPSISIDNDKTIIECNNGKRYPGSQNNISINTVNPTSYEDTDARKLCAYDIVNDFNNKYSVPDLKNYKIHLESSISGSWTVLMQALLISLSVIYITFSLIQVAFFYIVSRDHPFGIVRKSFRQHMLPILIIGILGVAITFNSYRQDKESVQNDLREASQKEQEPFQAVIANLPVTVLPTDDGINNNGSAMYADKYPQTFTIQNAATLTDKIAAYGAAYGVWIGPKGWTGTGGVGADGNEVVNLSPSHASINDGSSVSYYYVPACIGCMLDSAAVYFPSAMQERSTLSYATYPVTIPQGLQVIPISSTLATYTLPDANGLSTNGVAYYNPGDSSHDPYYYSARFVLPTQDKDLSSFLLQTFISQKDLK